MCSICIIGNDNRMNYVAECLFDYGYDIYRNEFDKKYDVIILEPVLSSIYEEIIFNCITEKTLIFLGRISEKMLLNLKKTNYHIYNYLEYEDIVIDNAKLTAQGIINEAIHDNAIIEESKCLVIGYGHCGKELVSELQKQNANIDVMVRRSELKESLYNDNLGYVDLYNINYSQLNKYSYIFNTVPAMIINKAFIDSLSENVMIFDIASKPGGVDFEYCKEKDIYVAHSLGIPGRHYPNMAGYIIGNAIHERLLNFNTPN